MRPTLIFYSVKLKIACFHMLQFSDLSDLGQDGTGQSLIFENVILWDFDILQSPASQAIQPRDPDTANEELDSVLSPVNLQGKTGCNCDLRPINYVQLVGITYSTVQHC